MGNGRQKEDNFGLRVGGATTIKLDMLTKKLGISTPLAQKIAKYLKMNQSSLDRAVMDEIMKHGGIGSIGAIRLRLRDGGLPRNKLLDIAHVFKTLREHGMIELVIGGPDGPYGDNAQYRTDVTQSDAKKVSTLPDAVITALAEGKRRNKE